MDLRNQSARAIAEQFKSGAVTAQSIAEGALAHTRETDPSIRAYLYLDEAEVLSQARVLDRLTGAERARLPLAGVPVALKDNMVTRNMPTTAGSRILGDFRSPYNATAVNKLLDAGALLMGKTNLDEFAMGSSTEHSAFHDTRNPWDLERVPGGSSGGSAAAVAAGMVPVALGSDTGGSIRQPAAFCGIVGLKPTYGRVSRYGLIAFASSLDQIGPFGRTVGDVDLVYRAIAGHDPHDATSLTASVEPLLEPRRNLQGLTIGVPREYYAEGIDPGVRRVVEAALETLKSLGATLREVSLPHTAYAIAAYYLIAPAEASSNLSRYDGVRYGARAEGQDLLTMYEETRDRYFGPEVKRRILLGTHALSAGYYDAYYLSAQKVRTLIRQDFEKAFGEVDLIMTPTTPELPFRVGEREQDLMAMYLSDIFTVTANLAGIPGLSMPAGMAEGLPVGIQWLAPPLGEGRMLAAAACLEAALPAMVWPTLGGTR